MTLYFIKNNLEHLLKEFKNDTLNIIEKIDNYKNDYDKNIYLVKKKSLDLISNFDNQNIRNLYNSIDWKNKDDFNKKYTKIKKIILNDLKQI